MHTRTRNQYASPLPGNAIPAGPYTQLNLRKLQQGLRASFNISLKMWSLTTHMK